MELSLICYFHGTALLSDQALKSEVRLVLTQWVRESSRLRSTAWAVHVDAPRVIARPSRASRLR